MTVSRCLESLLRLLAVVSAEPNLTQARAHLAEGNCGTPRVTLELATPLGEGILEFRPAASPLGHAGRVEDEMGPR